MARTSWLVCLVTAVLGVALIGPAWSQDQPKPDSPKSADGKGGDGKGGRTKGKGGFNPEDMRKRMEEYQARGLEQLKERLGASDDEWKELEPRIKKISTLNSRGGRTGFSSRGPGGPGGPPPGGSTGTPPEGERTEVSIKAEELRTLLENESAKPEQINKALEGLRNARKKQSDELEKARKELRELLTLRQEAILVGIGMLE